jgi:hypothetical protein
MIRSGLLQLKARKVPSLRHARQCPARGVEPFKVPTISSRMWRPGGKLGTYAFGIERAQRVSR